MTLQHDRYKHVFTREVGFSHEGTRQVRWSLCALTCNMHCESPLWLHWFVQDVALRGSRARSGDNVRDLRVLAHALVLRSGVVRRRSVDFRGDVNLQCIEHLGVALDPRRFDFTVAAAAATPRLLTHTPKPRATAAQ